MKNVSTNLNNLKNEVVKLDVPNYLSKLSDVVKNDVVKKDVYNAKIKSIKDKIPDVTHLATNASLKAKINEVKDEIPNINNLATATALNAKINEVKTNIPNVSNLIKKTGYNTKNSEIKNKITADHDHDKYITTREFNKLTSVNFTARLKQASLSSKGDIANFVKKTDFDNKLKDVTPNKN